MTATAMPGCMVCGFELWLPVAALPAADVGLYDDARFPGRLLVSSRRHFEHLDEMSPNECGGFMRDVQQACRALRSLDGVHRANVAVLGNQVSHVHAHVIPRRLDEPNSDRAPWDGAVARTPLEDGIRAEWVERISKLLIR